MEFAMRRAVRLSLCVALVSAFAGGDAALAKSRKPAPAPQGAVSQDPNAIPLPKDLTTNKDWLDDGAGNPASGTLKPNAQNNDNYFLEQRGGYDPTWYTENGSIMDNGTVPGW
ncbi:MAG: cellulose-binding protein [Hyphomicrobiales bacterium]|nr:MAG: cellulose-binding protein [Hyphomicrobiales bacterium]